VPYSDIAGPWNCDPHRPYGDQIEPLVLESVDGAAHQTPLDAVGLQKNERAFRYVILPVGITKDDYFLRYSFGETPMILLNAREK
jgi:hypothetical protein